MNADFEEASRIAVESTLRQLEHEDVLMVNRLSWLVASQSFLFTAYAIVLNQTLAAGTPVTVMRKGQLMQIVPELGLATCGLIYLGVVAGIYVTVALRRERKLQLAAAPGVRVRLQSSRATHALGLAAPLLLPPLFFAAWLVMLAD